MRLISADALADRLDSLAYDDWNQGVSTSWANAYSELAEMVRSEMFTVDAEPVRHGRWEYWSGNLYRCSSCGKGIADDDDIITGEMRYCHYCGAKMDGGEDG